MKPSVYIVWNRKLFSRGTGCSSGGEGGRFVALQWFVSWLILYYTVLCHTLLGSFIPQCSLWHIPIAKCKLADLLVVFFCDSCHERARRAGVVVTLLLACPRPDPFWSLGLLGRCTHGLWLLAGDTVCMMANRARVARVRTTCFFFSTSSTERAQQTSWIRCCTRLVFVEETRSFETGKISGKSFRVGAGATGGLRPGYHSVLLHQLNFYRYNMCLGQTTSCLLCANQHLSYVIRFPLFVPSCGATGVRTDAYGVVHVCVSGFH